jgi:hypothetical protein
MTLTIVMVTITGVAYSSAVMAANWNGKIMRI